MSNIGEFRKHLEANFAGYQPGIMSQVFNSKE